MAKMKNNEDAPKTDACINENNNATSLSSLEEMILRMRFGLKSGEGTAGSFDRDISDDLRKKLQFLELKAFEQSGRINDLLSDIEKKRHRR